jgi:hypothetical protein
MTSNLRLSQQLGMNIEAFRPLLGQLQEQQQQQQLMQGAGCSAAA